MFSFFFFFFFGGGEGGGGILVALSMGLSQMLIFVLFQKGLRTLFFPHKIGIETGQNNKCFHFRPEDRLNGVKNDKTQHYF